MTAGCTAGPLAGTPAPEPAPRSVELDGGARLLVSNGAMPASAQVSGGVVASPQDAPVVPGFRAVMAVQVITSAQPTAPVTVEIPVAEATVAELPTSTDSTILVLHQHEGQDWEPLVGRLDRTRHVVSVQTLSLSNFLVSLPGVKELTEKASDILNGYFGGVRFTTKAPTCPGERDVRAVGYSVRSSTSDVLRWCLGTGQGGKPQLKVVLNRRYPLVATMGTSLTVTGTTGGEFPVWLGQNATKIFGKPGQVTLSPSGTTSIDVDLPVGKGVKLVTEFDGFAQALVSLKVAADLVDTIFDKGARTAGEKAFGRMLSDGNCAAALQGVAADPDDGGRLGSMLNACIKPEDLGGGLLMKILQAAVVSTLAALGGVISYVWSSASYLNDLRQHKATYEIDVLHDAPSQQGVVEKDLLTAPVPAMCSHPAGRLSGGELKGLGPSEGYEYISSVAPTPYTKIIPSLFADFTGDRAGDAAAVLQCSAGGVSWPDTVLLYGPGTTLLGAADLMSVHEAEHATITTMTAENGDVRLRWSTYDGCCFDSMNWSARLHWDGHSLQILDAARA